MRGIVRAVAEVVQVAGRHRYGVGRSVSLTAHIHIDVVRKEVARLVFSVEQGKTVLDEPVPERLLVALERIDVGVLHQLSFHDHTFRLRLDVLQRAALVVDTATPVALLLLIKHLTRTLLCQVGTNLPGHPDNIVLQVGQYQAPQPGVVSLEGILRLLRIPGLTHHVIEVCQHGVVSVALLRVAVVVEDIPHQQVPCRPYHVLCPLVHIGEEVREEPPAQQEVLIDVLSKLAFELLRDEGADVIRCRARRHAVPYPAPQTLEGTLLRLRCGCPCYVFRVVELQRIVELCDRLRIKVCLPLEQAQGLRIVQELEGDRFIRIKSLDALHPDDLLPVALVMIEVVLSVIGRRVFHALRGEHVDGEAVNGRAHAAVRLLRRREEAQCLHHVVPQLRTAGVLHHRTVRVVRLGAQHLYFLLSGSQGYLQLLLLHAVHIHLRSLALGTVDAVVLRRVLRRTRALDADIDILQVDIPTVGQPQVHIGEEVRLLVVLGVHRVQSSLTHHQHDALALFAQFLEVDAPAVIAQHVILLEECGHLVQCPAVDDMVVHLLIVAQRAVIHPDGAYLHVRAGTVDGDAFRAVLHEVVALTVDVRRAPRAVHIQFHQPALGAFADDEGYLHPHVRAVLSAHADLLGGLPAVLVGYFLGGARVHHRLVGRYPEAFRAAHARHHACVLVRDVGHFHFHLHRAACGGRIGGERHKGNFCLRAIEQLQRITRPAARVPIHAVECRLHAAVFPVCRICLAVAASRRAELQLQPKRRFADVDTTLLHLDVKGIFRRTAYEPHFLCALCREAVGVGLHRPRNAHVLCGSTVHKNGHAGRCAACIIDGILERELLVLPSLQQRGQVVVSKDASVPEDMFRADQRPAAPSLENIHVDTLAAQRQPAPGFHLRHQLHRMTAYRQRAHRNGEAAVGGTAARYRAVLMLLAVHVEKYGLRARSLHGIGYHCTVACIIAASSCSVREGIVAPQRQAHCLHVHICLLRLRLSRVGVCRRGFYIDVGRTHLKVFANI